MIKPSAVELNRSPNRNFAEKSHTDFASRLAGLGFTAPVESAICDTFELEFGHLPLVSQRSVYHYCRRFVSFLRFVGWQSVPSLPANVLIRFRTWLQEQTLGEKTKYDAFSCVRRLVLSLARNFPHAVSPALRTCRWSYIRTLPTAHTFLRGEQVKRLLKCCYSDIEQIEHRLSKQVPVDARGRMPVVSDNPVLGEILAQFDGRIPDQKELRSRSRSLRNMVESHGGLRALTAAQWLSPADLVPFYIAILVQSAGNPMPVLRMRRSCITQHPLRTDLEFLEWYKPRAKREQRVEFPTNKEWSAPNVIRRLLRMNANLLPYSDAENTDKLFLAMVNRKAQVPSPGRMRALHQLFIKKHSLPPATFREYRAANAELHRMAAGNLASSQARLNHVSAQTTLLYVDRETMQAGWEQSIHHFQGQIVHEATARVRAPARASPDPGVYSDTLFGFGCAAPFAGVAPGSRVGELCENFSHCAQCPGALVPLDNPHVVARLLVTLAALERTRRRAEAEGWMQRFNALYSIPLHVLSVELLPRVSDMTNAQALPLMGDSAIPELE